MKNFKTKQPGILAVSDLKTAGGRAIYWLFFIILALAAFAALLPAIWTICTSFKDTQDIYNSFSFFPKNLTFDKAVGRISESWKYLQLGDAFLNTIILSAGDLVINVIVCGFGGYVLSKLKPKGSKLVFMLVVWTMMMPNQIRLVPNYISYLAFPFASDTHGVGINLLDTYWPMWFNAGADTFAVLLYKNAFDGLSDSFVEAAKIDGCTNYGVFFKIMLPLAMPIVIYQSITVLSGAWSDFFTPLLVLDKNTVVPLVVYRLQSDSNVQMNTYFMAFVFASIPPFLIFAIFQKWILGGVNVGGVKG
ncbi:MAG TPA: carbohydrate ABC transporter permease [Candidatus Ornithomonoglobus intestinigallinarum]|uniref:Carbohydrate ABC transporter permease n=1 Tax=Candidatus Ornithomonoglobus intestinigallinarum TaxID=2840894 RepID=A0A9D1H0G9_9FIRM|nr:carbohydrate ABC transporter permease [Candidatus Ornithomonoglobus intestinigallinarum]